MYKSISTATFGALVADNQSVYESLALEHNSFCAYFNLEKIPDRVVYARGVGAFGTFTLNKSVSEYSSAYFLQTLGEKTNVFVRFSTVGAGLDSSDFGRDPRGFAVKFYTQQGNFDIVGNNSPVFFLNDPINFTETEHSSKKNFQTNTTSAADKFEFCSKHPQSLHQLTILMSDRGIPASYRHIDGFSPNTLSFQNKNGERFWVKWHFKTDQGIKTLNNEEAALMPSFGAQKDLVDAINRKDFPSWTVQIQIMPETQASNCKMNPFDLTKVWPYSDYPLIEIGTLELNRNVDNYFAKTEQIPFSQSNLVPGIGASPDKMLQTRLLQDVDLHEDCFSQVGNLYRSMTENQKLELIKNIVDGLSQATYSAKQGMIEQFTKADPDYGQRIKTALQ